MIKRKIIVIFIAFLFFILLFLSGCANTKWLVQDKQTHETKIFTYYF